MLDAKERDHTRKGNRYDLPEIIIIRVHGLPKRSLSHSQMRACQKTEIRLESIQGVVHDCVTERLAVATSSTGYSIESFIRIPQLVHKQENLPPFQLIDDGEGLLKICCRLPICEQGDDLVGHNQPDVGHKFMNE